MLILITGRSGTGKSAVCAELVARGLSAFGTDEDGISAWFENESGRMVELPPREVWRTPEWQTTHTWAMRRDRLEDIANLHPGATVFICGTAAGELEMVDLFSHVIRLVVRDEEVIRARIKQRSGNQFGKEPHELEAILAGHRSGRPCHGQEATEIDAASPLGSVVDQIIAVANGSTPMGSRSTSRWTRPASPAGQRQSR